MEQNNNNNNDIQSSSLKIQTLQKEYEVTLQQYQEAVRNYINSLKSTDNIYVALHGRSWWGMGPDKEGTIANQTECETMCSNSDKCTGATFNPVKRYCWTRTGDGDISTGETDNYALVPQQKATLIAMRNLNYKLLKINKEITEEIAHSSSSVQIQTEEQQKQQQNLYQSQQSLLEQKREMEQYLQEYKTVEEDVEMQTLYVEQQSSLYNLWFIIACVLLLVVINKMTGANLHVSFLLVIIVGLIILTKMLSTPTGFAIWFALVIGGYIWKSKQ